MTITRPATLDDDRDYAVEDMLDLHQRLAADPGVRIGATFVQLLRGPSRLPVQFS
jgi:hypothetical protein